MVHSETKHEKCRFLGLPKVSKLRRNILRLHKMCAAAPSTKPCPAAYFLFASFNILYLLASNIFNYLSHYIIALQNNPEASSIKEDTFFIFQYYNILMHKWFMKYVQLIFNRTKFTKIWNRAEVSLQDLETSLPFALTVGSAKWRVNLLSETQ